MQRYAVKFFERIRKLSSRSGEAGVQWDALHLTGAHGVTLVRIGAAKVDGMRFLDVTEIDGVDAAALVRDDGRLRMPQKSPRSASEERVGFDVRCTRTGAEPAELVFDEQLAYERSAETGNMSAKKRPSFAWMKTTHFDVVGAEEPSGNGTSSLKIFAKVAFRFLPLKGVVPNSIS